MSLLLQLKLVEEFGTTLELLIPSQLMPVHRVLTPVTCTMTGEVFFSTGAFCLLSLLPMLAVSCWKGKPYGLSGLKNTGTDKFRMPKMEYSCYLHLPLKNFGFKM